MYKGHCMGGGNKNKISNILPFVIMDLFVRHQYDQQSYKERSSSIEILRPAACNEDICFL